MTSTVIRTRKTSMSERKACGENGAAYRASWVGTAVAHTDSQGQQHLGVIARFENGYPIAEFNGGGWARLDFAAIEVVVAP